MPITIILAALAVAASLPLLWVSVASRRTAGASNLKRRTSPLAEVTDARELILSQGAGSRLGMPMLRSLGSTLRRVTPAGWVDSLRRRLVLAGKADRFSLERLLVVKFALAAGGLVVSLMFLSGLSGAMFIVATAVLTAIGFFLPDAVVSSQADTRQESIRMELSDTLDQVRMTVDAGLGFEAALGRVARTGDGPLAEELHRTLREIQLGVPRHEALRNLADRTDVQDLNSFVLAVVQSEGYGIPIAKVLRVQSEELRDKRRQAAEERALKIPVLLIFPLAFCVFPVIFIVLLGPAIVRIVRDLGPAI